MSIQSDIITALAGVADDKVYPAGEVPDDTEPPFVAYRRTLLEPVMTLQGYAGVSKSTFIFECWGQKTDSVSAKQASLTLADEVIAAIDADTTIRTKYREPVSGEEYEPDVLELMEPVQYSFFHA